MHAFTSRPSESILRLPVRAWPTSRGLLLAAGLVFGTFFGIAFGAPPLGAQELPAPPVAAAGREALPRGFRGIELGLSREEVIARLQADPLFGYRGPEDVSLLATPNESLIEVEGPSFVSRAFFQFVNDRLWVIIVQLNPRKIDHYSVYTSLVAKYGEPGSLDPRESRWENGELRLSLERPLSLRYLDLATFSAIRADSAARESAEELERKDFLGGL